MFNAINPGLEPGSKVTWDDVVIQTPWMTKSLHGMTGSQELTVRHQPLPQPGESSELELTLETMYSMAYAKLHPVGRGKVVAKDTPAPGIKPATPPPGLPKVGRGAVPKVRLRKDNPGDGWSHIAPKDLAQMWDTRIKPQRKRNKCGKARKWPGRIALHLPASSWVQVRSSLGTWTTTT